MSSYGLPWTLSLMFSVVFVALYFARSEQKKGKMLINIVLICISISFVLQGIAEFAKNAGIPSGAVSTLGYVAFYVAYFILNVCCNSLFRNSKYNIEENGASVKYILGAMNAFLIVNLMLYLYW